MAINIRKSLRARAILFVVLVITLALAAVLMTVSLRINRYIEQEQQALAAMIADTTARAVSEPLAMNNTMEISRIMRTLIATQNVLFIVVTDIEGRILAQEIRQTRLWEDYQKPQSQKAFLSAEAWVAAPGTVGVVDPLGKTIPEEESETPSDEPPVTYEETITAPQFIGKVMVAVSRSPTVMAQKAQQRIMLAVFSFALLISGLIVFITVSHWTRKLNRLVHASWRIAHGNLSHTLTVKGEDEIGRLTEAFESMRKSLRRRDMELKKLNETLKQQIKDRTLEIELEKDRFEADTVVKSGQQSAIADHIRRISGELATDSELLLKDPLSERQRRGVTSIKAVSGTLQTLAQSIVSSLRQLPSSQPATKKAINLYTMVGQVMKRSLTRAITQNVLMLYDFAHDTEHCAFANEEVISPLISTALEEALKQSPQACVTIDVWRNSIAANQALFSFEIRCTKVAADKDQPLDVFRKFLSLQLSPATKQKRDAGDLVQQVEKAGGRLHIETHYKKGSLLRFEFVLVTDAEQSANALITPAQKATLKDAHVLLASTSECLRSFVHKTCESVGTRLVSVSTEQKLWNEVKHGLMTQDPYACILVESVEGMNGDVLMQKIHKELPDAGFQAIVLEPHDAVVSGQPSAALAKALVKAPLSNIDILITLSRVLKN